MLCKGKRQYLLTFKISRFYLLTLHGSSVLLGSNHVVVMVVLLCSRPDAATGHGIAPAIPVITEDTGHFDKMLCHCCASVADAVPALAQR